jgi:NifU-like protein involved in Fe-S cluster formation
MSEPIQPIIEITTNNTITDITHQQTIETSRQLKTNDYTLNAVKRYRLKNADKMKEYHKQYSQNKREEKLKENPDLKLNKIQLIEKIKLLEEKIKLLEQK